MQHDPPSLRVWTGTLPPGSSAPRSGGARRCAAIALALALKVGLLAAGGGITTLAHDMTVGTSAAFARDGGGEGEGEGDGGGGGDDGGNSGRGGDDGGNSGRGGDDGGNSGPGGDDGGKSGPGGDDGPDHETERGDDSGHRGRGSDDRADNAKGRSVVDRFLDTLKGRGRVVWASSRGSTIEVRYSDGWSERVDGGGYSLLDPRRNVVVRRPAKPTDVQRLRAAAAR